MTRTTPTSVCQVEDLPPTLRAGLSAPAPARGSWVWKLGPAFAGLFIWVPLLDPAGALVLGDAGLGLMAATAVLAVIACHALLYSVPALAGLTSGKRLGLAAASTFGTSGSEWITGLAVGLAGVVLQAVSIYVSMWLTLLGLVSCRLVAPAWLEPWQVGVFSVMSPVFLLTAAFWIFITGMASLLRLIGVIGALMQVYTPIALLLLGGTALLLSPGLSGFEAARAAALAQEGGVDVAIGAPARLFQLVFGSFALSGLLAVDWGLAVEHRRDVRIGGWMAIVLAGSYGLIMAMLTVAGAIGALGSAPAVEHAESLAAQPLFHRAVYLGLPGFTGGVILLLFGLACLAPACFAAWIHSHRFAARWPRLRRFAWTWIAALPVFLLIVSSWAGRLEIIFSLLGAVFAPAVGAMAADFLLQRGQWRGVHLGWNPPGFAAWGLGLLVGLIPVLGPPAGWHSAAQAQPASLYAFLLAAVAYAIGWSVRETPAPVGLPEVSPADGEPMVKG